MLSRFGKNKQEQIQNYIETNAIIDMALIMILASFGFTKQPNLPSFKTLSNSGLKISSLSLGHLCLVGAITYLIMLMPFAKRIKPRFRRTLFMFASFPLIMYVLPLGVIGVQKSAVFGSIAFIAIYFILFLVAFAIFNKPSRRLEILVISTLITLFSMAAISFLLMPSMIFGTFSLSPYGFSILSILSTAIYSLFFTDRVKWLPNRIKRFMFILAQMPVPTYAIFLMVNTLNNGSLNLVPTLALIDLSFLISLMGNSIYRDD